MKKLDDLEKIIDTNLDKLDMSQERKLKLSKEAKMEKKLNFKKISYIGIPIIAAMLAFIIVFTNSFFSNSLSKVYADNLMEGIKPQKVKTVQLSNDFIQGTANFSIDLFKHSYKKGDNSLISPTSVYLALGMTANGADGNTLKQFENILGNKNLNLSDLNSYYHSLTNNLMDAKGGKLSIANSIWYRNDPSLNIEKNFLQTNADYYNASIYKADFNKSSTVNDINNWVKNNTGNQIDKIIDKIDPNTIMYLINAIYFEDQWDKPYSKEDVSTAPFELMDGTKKSVDFMHSTENVYIKDDKAEGFIKPYENGKYSFAAILPNEGINIDDYISSLSGESFMNLINSQSQEPVSASLPKFKYDYQVDLVAPLKQMGLKDCFGNDSNFNKMDRDNGTNIYVGDILHKTSIIVAEEGTKAAAVTKVEMQQKCEEVTPKTPHIINLNRPFLYAIIDNETKLPIFIGVTMNP